MVATAGLLAYTSLRMARPPAAEDADASPGGEGRRDHPALLVALGVAAGLLSGLLGVGGGAIMVPGFSVLARMPLKTTIACSLVCVGVLAVPATLTHWSLGDVDWPTAGLLSLGVVPGARLGAAATVRAEDRRLRVAVAALLGAVAVVYGAGEAVALVRTS